MLVLAYLHGSGSSRSSGRDQDSSLHDHHDKKEGRRDRHMGGTTTARAGAVAQAEGRCQQEFEWALLRVSKMSGWSSWYRPCLLPYGGLAGLYLALSAAKSTLKICLQDTPRQPT